MVLGNPHISKDKTSYKYDVLIVGSGLSGVVIAERLAIQKGLKVLVIDKRKHIGGNYYDYVDKNRILINKYGAHIFHTNDEDVWRYVNKFGKWRRWVHKVLSYIDGKYVNVPVNINTVNALCGTDIKNSEEVAKSSVGEELDCKICRNYTI